MQKVIRLDTETFIMECRNGYDLTKIKDRICELELVLNVRNKEIQLLTSHLANCQQQNANKIRNLEEKIIMLQQQCADLRFQSVRNKRLQIQKAQQQIKTIRLQYESMLQQQQQKHLKAYRLIQQKYKQELQKKQEKKVQVQQYKEEQSKTIKEIKSQRYASTESKIKSMEKQKLELLVAKKQAQKRVQSLTQNYKNIKDQYQSLISQKQDLIASLKGQIQGHQLKQNLLYKQLQQQRHKYSQLRFNKHDDMQTLRILNQKLQSQNDKLNELINSKNEEIFEWINESRNIKSREVIIPQIEDCQHIGLINQLQRSLELKSLELQQIKSKMNQWTSKIGFDQPITSRLDTITKKIQKVDKMRANQSKNLRQKGNQYAYQKIR